MPKIIGQLRNFLSARKLYHRDPQLVETLLLHVSDLEWQVNGPCNRRYIGVDYDLSWPLDEASRIGTSGWQPIAKKTLWVGLDFDLTTDHAKGISGDDLLKVEKALLQLDYVELRRSTGGSGLHAYVYLNSIPSQTRKEHRAIALKVQQKISDDTGIDIAAYSDHVGEILWVWSRENCGFKPLQPSKIIRKLSADDLPANTPVTANDDDTWQELAVAYLKVELDATHKQHLAAISQYGICLWDSDLHIVKTHTVALKKLYETGTIKGLYQTSSPGSELDKQNCFMAPIANGGWRVVRFGLAQEADTWIHSRASVTCLFNATTSLSTAAKSQGAAENPLTGEWILPSIPAAQLALKAIGTDLCLPDSLSGRPIVLKKLKDGRMLISAQKNDNDTNLVGWVAHKKQWIKTIEVEPTENPKTYDDSVRALATESGERAGWLIKQASNEWARYPKDDVKNILLAQGTPRGDVDHILGDAMLHPWTSVSQPFQPKFLPGRKYNVSQAGFCVEPSKTQTPIHPTWDMLLAHLGESLDDPIKKHEWCKTHNIKDGKDWLVLWLSTIIQEPHARLPCIFAWGGESTGKSFLRKAISLVIDGRAVVEANQSLQNDAGYNGELAGAVLAFVEEIDLSKSTTAKNRFKNFTANDVLAIRTLYQPVYSVPNTTHWYHSANSPDHSAISGHDDTRVVILNVQRPKTVIEKNELLSLLGSEASDFLATLLKTKIPKSEDSRFRIPLIETDERREALCQADPIGEWLKQNCTISPHSHIPKKEAYEHYSAWSAENEIEKIAKSFFGRRLIEATGGVVRPSKIRDGQTYIQTYKGVKIT